MANGWFGRIFIAFLSLYLVLITVMGLIMSLYDDMDLHTWDEFLEAKMRHAMQGLDYTVPSVEAAFRMSGATLFQQFVACLFGAILMFGVARLTLKAVRNDSDAWFSSSFGGFARPLELTWLVVRMNLQVFLWSLLFVIPGVVAIYRYRQAWYLKARNPDWTASKCIAESCRMMDGYKWKAFALDFSFLGWLMAACAVVALSFATGNMLAGTLSLAGAVFILCYFFAARAVFFRELVSERGEVTVDE
jgi:uncharacterized membrane protein